MVASQKGAQPVATFHSAVPPTAYGRTRISVRRLGSKTMLHLQPCGESAVCTLTLCHRNETMLNELKVNTIKAVLVGLLGGLRG